MKNESKLFKVSCEKVSFKRQWGYQRKNKLDFTEIKTSGLKGHHEKNEKTTHKMNHVFNKDPLSRIYSYN